MRKSLLFFVAVPVFFGCFLFSTKSAFAASCPAGSQPAANNVSQCICNSTSFAQQVTFAAGTSLPSVCTPPSGPTNCDPSQNGLDLANCLSLNDTQNVASVYNKPTVLINLLVRNAFVVGGLILFFMIMFAGYQMIADGTAKGKDQAAETIKTAILGFGVMFAAFWILQIIKVVTGADIIF